MTPRDQLQVPPLRFAPVGTTIHILVRDASAKKNRCPDKKVTGSLDDDFVEVSTKNTLNKLARIRTASWAKFRKFRRPCGAELGTVALTQTLKPSKIVFFYVRAEARTLDYSTDRKKDQPGFFGLFIGGASTAFDPAGRYP
jgi:hypothetical protein